MVCQTVAGATEHDGGHHDPVRPGRPGFPRRPVPDVRRPAGAGRGARAPAAGHPGRGVARRVFRGAARARPRPDLGRRRTGRRISRPSTCCTATRCSSARARRTTGCGGWSRARSTAATRRGSSPRVRALAGRLVAELVEHIRADGSADLIGRRRRGPAGGGDRGAARCAGTGAFGAARLVQRDRHDVRARPRPRPARGRRARRRRVRRGPARARRPPSPAPRRRPRDRSAGRRPRSPRAGRHRRAAAHGGPRGHGQRHRQRGARTAAPPRAVAAAARRPRTRRDRGRGAHPLRPAAAAVRAHGGAWTR